jgi:hypothetical protein
VGHSGNPNSRLAGQEAAAAAFIGAEAKLLIVFTSVQHDLEAVVAGVNDVGGDVPMIGCTTQGEICPGGPHDGSVVVAALGGEGFSVTTAIDKEVSGRQRDAGSAVASAVTSVGDDPARPYRVLIVLTDGLTRDQETILRGIYSVLGATVPLVGGAAGDAYRMQRTSQFHGSEVVSDGLVAAYLQSESPLAVSVGHGWSKVGEPMIVTAASDGRVNELDNEPALDAYLRRFNAPPEVYVDAAAFTSFAMSRPVGVLRRNGEEVRDFSTEVRFDDRSLCGGTGIPQGSLLWPMSGTTETLLDAVDRTCTQAAKGLGGLPPVGYLTFSCSGVRKVLGDEGIVEEAARISAHAAGAAYAGFYTYGEIARNRGIDGFHNHTFAVLALS